MNIIPGGRKEYTFRMVVLGDFSVGKSSLALQYVKNKFNSNEESTIGAAFLTKTVYNKGDQIKYEIWDTAGQERYNSLIPMYYRGAQIILIVYAITSVKSFEKAKEWVEELRIEKPNNCIKVLIGNKLDLNEERKVPTEVGEDYAREKNLLFAETSAKDNTNIENIFTEISDKLPRTVVEEKEKVINVGRNKQQFGGCC